MASNKQVASLAAAPYIPQSPPFPSSPLLSSPPPQREKEGKQKPKKQPPSRRKGKKIYNYQHSDNVPETIT
jgi:hypothetical protein